MFSKPSEEKPTTDARKSGQFPPPINTLFSIDLPGLATQVKPEEHQPKPTSAAQILSSLESSAKNYLLQQQSESAEQDASQKQDPLANATTVSTKAKLTCNQNTIYLLFANVFDPK